MSKHEIPVQVTITNDQIDKAIIDSLIGTKLGEEISKEIERSFGSGYGQIDINRMVQRLVEKQIEEAVKQLLLVEHADTIKAFVTDKMTDDFVNATFESMWEAWKNRR